MSCDGRRVAVAGRPHAGMRADGLSPRCAGYLSIDNILIVHRWAIPAYAGDP